MQSAVNGTELNEGDKVEYQEEEGEMNSCWA